MRHRLLWLLSVLVVIAPRTARADRFPASSAVVFDPMDSKTIYVRATFGVLTTRDAGDSWRWICDRAVGVSGSEDPTYVVTPKGTLVGATLSGAAVSRDHGCNFGLAGSDRAAKYVLTDLTMREDGELIGVSSVAKVGDEGASYDNQVYSSKDDAQTFSALGAPIDPALLLVSVAVAETDPARLYVSAVRGEGETRTGALLASYNGGESWVERKLELTAGEMAPSVASVDPKNADRVYVRTAGPRDADAKARLLMSDDAGKTWRKIFDSPSPILGFALAADGARVYAGTRAGLVSSPTDTFVFGKGSSADIQCLGLNGHALWACSTERSGFFVGVSRGGGKNFDARLHLEEIKGPLECPDESSVAKACIADWPKLRRELGLPDVDAKPRSSDPGAPALRGRGTRTMRTRSPMGAAFAFALVGMAVYYIVKRFRRGG